MIRYFYRVEFSYYENEHSNGSLDLGIFSTKKKAEEKIRRSVNLTGFNKYGIDNFKIIKFGVNFDVAPEDKSKAIFYSIVLEYEIKNGEYYDDYYVYYGYVCSMEKALARVEDLKKHDPYAKKYPDNIEIIEEIVDLWTAWSEGFVSWYDD